MAQRRMFSKSITSSSSFIMMPPTTRLLYYDLGMNADDDGFCEHYVIMKMTDATPDDLRILQTKGFVKVFNDRVLIILDWKENNYIQKDRYTPSKYLKEYEKELKLLATNEQPNNNQLDTKCIQNVNTGKVRLGKVREDIVVAIADQPSKIDNTHLKVRELFDYYKEVFLIKISDTPPIFAWGQCEKMAKNYINTLGLNKMKQLLDKYFKSDDKLYKDNAYSLSCFLSNKIIHQLNQLK